jgi:hypothetical protein
MLLVLIFGIIVVAYCFVSNNNSPSRPTLKQLKYAYNMHLEYSKQPEKSTLPQEILCLTKKDREKWNEFAINYYKTILQQEYFEELD